MDPQAETRLHFGDSNRSALGVGSRRRGARGDAFVTDEDLEPGEVSETREGWVVFHVHLGCGLAIRGLWNRSLLRRRFPLPAGLGMNRRDGLTDVATVFLLLF